MEKTERIIDNYFELARKTCKEMSSLKEHTIHMALGLSSEFCEFLEALYLSDRYFREELGDMFWYAANMAQSVFIKSLRDVVDLDTPEVGLDVAIGNFVSEAKRIYVYDKEIDETTLANLICDVIKSLIRQVEARTAFSIEEVLAQNIEKLKLRYPEGFTNEAAVIRADKNA